MRAFWTGDVAFGKVLIPVKLCTGTKDESSHFHLLHKTCSTKIIQVKRCPECKKDLEAGEIGRGVEVSKGKHVLLTEKELAELDGGPSADGETKKQRIVVISISSAPVDLMRLEKCYWTLPGSIQKNSYALLRDTLISLGRVAIVEVALRSKPRAGVLSPWSDLLTLTMLRPKEELVEVSEEDKGTNKVTYTSKEAELAKALAKSFEKRGEPDLENREERARLLESAIYGKSEPLEEALAGSLPTKKSGR